ncbi:MAG: ATP-binding protein [Pseudomonadota bacterium]
MKSLRSRLIVAGTVILTVFGFSVFVALNRSFHASAVSAQEEKMKGLVYALLGSIDAKPDGPLVLNEMTVQEQRFFSKGSGLEALVVGEDGAVIWNSPSMENRQAFPAGPVETGQWTFSPSPEFLLGFGVSWATEPEKSRKFTIYVRENGAQYSHQLRIFHGTLVHWLIGAFVLLLITLLALLNWVLRPLKRVVNELDEIRAGNREGVGTGLPHELHPLAEGLNSLLRHERGQQKRFRHALDDLAHSLKTPLAALRAAGDERQAGPIEQISTILDYQVRKASTVGRTAFTQRIEAKGVAGKLISALSKVYREKGVEFENRVEETVAVPVDEGDLMEIFGNLLDNAAKWCKGRVAISGTVDIGRMRITVEDDGPGFPKENRGELLRRGVRADRRVAGEGIGLAVVAEIVHLYEGELELGESGSGGGKVSLSIPI